MSEVRYEPPSSVGSELPPFRGHLAGPATLEPVRAMSLVVLGLGAIYTAMGVLAAGLSWTGLGTEGDFSSNVFGIPLNGSPGGALVLLNLVLWIVASTWLLRARRNARLMSPQAEHVRSEVWVWLGWVIPIVSFWFPYQVVRDIVRGSLGPDGPRRVTVGWWWAAWVLPLILNPVTRGSIMEGGAVSQTTSVNASMATVNAVLGVVAFAFWVRIVRAIVDAQESRSAGAA